MSARREGFVSLHTHSAYSARDGLSKLDEMCARVAEDNQPALAITDHGNLAASWKFTKAAEKAGVSPIYGCELYLSIGDRHDHSTMPKPPEESDAPEAGQREKKYDHLTVLAENSTGWRNLLLVQNEAQNTFWTKPRADIELLGEHKEGLIILTGCLGGPIQSRLVAGDYAAAEANLAQMVEIFGTDQVFVEVMSHGIPSEERILPQMLQLAKRFGLRVVATNDSHFTHASDAHAHEGWLCDDQSGKTIYSPNAWKFTGSGYHLRTAAEMRALFDDQPGFEEAIDNTLLIAERCMSSGTIIPKSGLRLPQFDPDGPVSDDDLLYEEAKAGAIERYGHPLSREVKERLRYELDIIKDKGFSSYFLMTADMINEAKRRGSRVGPGRGSAAGSCVSYCLGIIAIDPLKHGLLFERFLSPTRSGMPDIDVDFQKDMGDEIITYLAERWGHDRVARIGTIGLSRAKQSLKSAGKVLGKPQVGNKLADAVPTLVGGKPAKLKALLDPDFLPGAPFRTAAEATDSADVIDFALAFEDVVRSEGIHPCGVVLSNEDLPGIVPLRRDRKSDNPDRLVTEWTDKDVEAAGFLKVDVLRLENLDGISATLRLIKASTGEEVDPDLATDDPNAPGIEGERARAAWRLIAEGKTSGLFQLAGGGMTELAQRIQPQSIDDLSAIVALYRPGPMGEGLHTLYAERKAGLKPVDYDQFTTDPREVAIISSVLAETFALPTYQEQLMRLSEVVSGFGPVERDRLRKAVAKKIAEEMAEVGRMFIEGAISDRDLAGNPKLAFSHKTADNLWTTFQSFGEYAFNKAHSVGYAKIAYEGAWLKANWPAAFAAGWLAVATNDEKRLAVLSQLASEGVIVRGPSVNHSDEATGLDDDGSVRMGLAEIKGITGAASVIVAERKANGPFTSLADLSERVKVYAPAKDGVPGKERQLPTNVLEGLIEAGACDEFGPRFGMIMAINAMRIYEDTPIPDFEWGIAEKTARERGKLGVLTSPSPLAVLVDQIKEWRSPKNGNRPTPLHRLPGNGDEVQTVGVVGAFKIEKKNVRFAKMTLIGSKIAVECIMWSQTLETLERQNRLPKVGDIVGVDARVKEARNFNAEQDHDFTDDGSDDDTVHEPVADVAPKKELVVENIWSGPLDDEPTFTLPEFELPAPPSSVHVEEAYTISRSIETEPEVSPEPAQSPSEPASGVVSSNAAAPSDDAIDDEWD